LLLVALIGGTRGTLGGIHADIEGLAARLADVDVSHALRSCGSAG
jgi:hypothetical protein